jgi:putative transposase
MEPGQFYHIYNHGIGFENIFHTNDNYLFFLKKYAEYLNEVVDTYAYCLMPNHFHFLIRVKDNLPGFKNLAGSTDHKLYHASNHPVIKGFSDFFNSYAKSFNKINGRKGSLFQKNFRKNEIKTELQWQDTFLYIHMNPVKHGFVKEPKDWKWSSLHAYRNLNKPSLIERSFYLNYFDSWENYNYIAEIKKELLMERRLE